MGYLAKWTLCCGVHFKSCLYIYQAFYGKSVYKIRSPNPTMLRCFLPSPMSTLSMDSMGSFPYLGLKASLSVDQGAVWWSALYMYSWRFQGSSFMSLLWLYIAKSFHSLRATLRQSLSGLRLVIRDRLLSPSITKATYTILPVQV